MTLGAAPLAVPAASSSPSPELSLSRVFWLFAQLRLVRLRNRGWLGTWQPNALATLSRRRSAPAGRGLLLLLPALLGLLSYQSFKSLGEIVRAHGMDRLPGHAAVLLSLNVLCLLAMALPGSRAADPGAGDDTEWLSTLPAPAWVLHAARVAEAALFNPVGWMLLFPFLTALGIHTGAGVLAPLIALALTLPILACCALLGSVIDAAQLALSQSRAFRVLRILGPLLGTFVFLFWMGAPSLSSLNVSAWQWLASLPQVRWLPFSEPAWALAAWRSAPLDALRWFGLFGLEMVTSLALGTLALRKLYRADLVYGRDARRGRRGLTAARAGAAPRRARAGLLGAMARADALWLRRNPARGVHLLGNVVLVNGIVLLFAVRGPRPEPEVLPGYALFAAGTLLLVGQSFALERERPALGYWSTVPRPLSRIFASKTLLMAALAILGSLPSVSYVGGSLSRPLVAITGLLWAVVAVLGVAFLQTALWLLGVSFDAPLSAGRKCWNVLLVLFFAYWLGSTTLTSLSFGSAFRVLPPLVSALALVAACWAAALARAPFVIDASAPEPKVLTTAHALVTLLLMRDQQAAAWADGWRRGLPALPVVTLAFFVSTVVLVVSLSLLRRKFGVTGLRERLGFRRGKGWRVILREGLLWSVPAIACNFGYWALFTRGLAPAIQQAPPQPPLLGVLAASPPALVIIGCLAVPLVEELTYRGMLYRSMRSAHGMRFSLLGSGILFALDHPPASIVPVFFAGLCMTLAFERSRSLYASLLVHVLYNAAAAWVTLRLQGA